ncbi:hypothetical protein [Candidatus Berkiella aquae]|uniref:Uncharacterized protein n=1 Tax=Candidatus Berkiella aquae TaxID=295108 RepID=A0A0Q9YU86_9GAMM|nr:hypothetical protein [Candidatus Berkiella aquae]MCS5710850.1 hypothetical protein [Candidatus Berkiella aquae]
MVAPKKAKKVLEHALTELSHWITQHSHSPNQPKAISVRDIPVFVEKLQKQISHFVEELIESPALENVAKEFKGKCDEVQDAVSQSLLPANENSEKTVNALKQLQKVVTNALKKLNQVFKELFKNSVITAAPTFTPHHGQQVVHLANEQKFKSHGSHSPQVDSLRHYNIPPGKKG